MRIIDWSSDVCSSDLPGAAAPEPALQRLVHRRVVVARLDPGDVVAPVLAAHRAVGVEYHARGHRGLAHGVADVEALDALRQVGQAEHVAQRFDPRALSGLAAELGGERHLGVAARKVQEAGAVAATDGLDLHPAAGGGAEAVLPA